jgi:hypothetical protein
VLFSGHSSRNDTWEWDGVAWTRKLPANSPPPRGRAGIAYDAARRKTVLFGGVSSTYHADTWEWDGSDWIRHAPAASPAPRQYGAMAYDSGRGRTVLFGGNADSSFFRDTWEWDGGNWVRMNPAVSPSARTGHALAYDALRQRVVLFGGSHLDDTWEWDGTSWTRRIPATSPPPRSYHAMTYDSARRRIVLWGGLSNPRPEAWEWDGAAWSVRATVEAPLVRWDHGLVHDSVRGRTVLFGGLAGSGYVGDTWEYGPISPADYTASGSGCAGGAGTPALAREGGYGPWLGDWFALELTHLPRVPSALVWLGWSKTSWGSLRLPVDLGVVGMPGCALRVSPDVGFVIPTQGANARLDLWIPADVSLLGRPFHNQAVVVDRAANALGAIVSNAGEGRIGAK